MLIEIDYSSLHPVTFHVRECLGPFTETSGFDTSFKNCAYEQNFAGSKMAVVDAAMSKDIGYKLVNIAWCSQVHPDP